MFYRFYKRDGCYDQCLSPSNPTCNTEENTRTAISRREKRRSSLANIVLIKMNSGDLPAAEKERANRPSPQEVHRQQFLSPLSDSHTETESAESETETTLQPLNIKPRMQKKKKKTL